MADKDYLEISISNLSDHSAITISYWNAATEIDPLAALETLEEEIEQIAHELGFESVDQLICNIEENGYSTLTDYLHTLKE